jgi:chemotaxis response regulator CheB
MLNEVVRAAISSEPDMTIVDLATRDEEDLGAMTRRRRIDVVICPADNDLIDDVKILRLLKTNPRVSLIAIDGLRDAGTLHHLVPAHEAIGPLAQMSLTAAIRAGASLRKP